MLAVLSFAQGTDSPLLLDWMHQDKRTEEPDEAYIKKCTERRNNRLKTLKKAYPKIVFTKHFDLGGSHYAYTEAQSDAQAERNFVPGSSLCMLSLGDNDEYRLKTLIADPNGVIRDPTVTFDGKKIIFAWKKSDRLDDYHLYEFNVETSKIRQLTFGLGYADYEPCPLPNGDIIFNSTRCVQVVDCWWTEVSNLYVCDKDGKFLRRLSFDQVHTNYPALMDDGRVIYTRWDYNDRGQIFPQGMFQMNADGTAQTEFYGNNSWFPTTLMHTRPIPGSNGKAVSIFSGHHNRQYGKLGIVDTTKGRQENSGTQLIAPVRETTADRIDAWGQWGDRFSHPYPINEKEFIVAYNYEFADRTNRENQHTVQKPFGLYWMNADGERELLAYDSKISCNQPFPLVARKPVPIRASVIDPNSEYGVYTMEDVYFGPGLEGIDRGAAKTLRVIALDFRSVGIGSNSNGGPSGGAMVSTPVSVSNGTWDVKIPLGDVPINEDGSASFKVPARTPVYFQVLDENGHCIQTMRSWSTLQPGETFSCVGCHEDKNTMEHPNRTSVAMQKGPQDLKPFYGEPRGFSFPKEIQPILDKHCVNCHNADELDPPFRVARNKRETGNQQEREYAESRKKDTILELGAKWHYTTEKPGANWTKPEYFKTASKLPIGDGGFGFRPGKGFKTPWNSHEIWMWTKVVLPADWVPREMLLQYFHDEDLEIHVNGQRFFSESGFTPDYSYTRIPGRRTGAFKAGENIIAVHVVDTGGGRGVDLGLWEIEPDQGDETVIVDSSKPRAFSLKNTPILDSASKRYWSKSYLNLTNSQRQRPDRDFLAYQTPVVNWINVQDVPSMITPYKAGAASSSIMKMFDPNLLYGDAPHNDVKLSREELDKLACWIDLLIPFCGDYIEANAWDEFDMKKFAYYEQKKKEMERLHLENTAGYFASTGGGVAGSDNPYRNLLNEAKTGNDWKEIRFEKPVRTDQFSVMIEKGKLDWTECTLEFSNGFKKRIVLQDNGKRQVFTFPPQKIEWLKLTEFKPGEKKSPEKPARFELHGLSSVSRTYIAPGTEEK